MTSDRLARERALDPTGSFIVQAPAGAGKTGLLAQRYLALLAAVDAPEQIVAITFTIKAAAEMRRRILEALRDENSASEARNDYELRTRELARAARERARELNWKLEEHPARLRIQTIDAFCLTLAAQSPLLSRAGAELRITAEPRPHYRAAALRTFEALDDPAIGPALEFLLEHRDNQVGPTLDDVAAMLEQRDQWLPLVLELEGAALRARLEADLEREIVGHLARVRGRWPRENLAAVTAIAAAAAKRLPPGSTRLGGWSTNGALPAATIEELPRWRGLAGLLLTNEGTWRKAHNVNDGLPREASREKEALKDLIEELARIEGLQEDLHGIRELPAEGLPEEQWRIAEALIAVLKRAAQELEIEFRARGEVDFIAVAAAARQALGRADAPSELALALDLRIRHLLVDEYQDTSVSQFRLLEQLTAGWTPGDGRTLFCVGDPMQSIYRFRQAEVGLFLRTRDRGLGALRLEPLRLTQNFRSQEKLVAWSNEVFRSVLPPADDVARGAVKHAPSEAAHPAADPALVVHPFLEDDPAAEAEAVIAALRDFQARHPQDTLGILVRQRKHVVHIAALLAERGIPYQAVEIERLGAQPVVRDLMAVARALLHEGDRTAWLALLRSPVCGLTLRDLETLTRDGRDRTLRELMGDGERRALLSEDGRRRMERAHEVLERALVRHGTFSLRQRVEGVWLALGGPAAASGRRALADANAFLDKLDAIERDAKGALPAGAAFEALFSELQAHSDPLASDRVQVMTVHKAKGLEFGAVLLPGLGKGRGESDRTLLNWLEVPQPDGSSGLLLAPIKRKGAEGDPLTRYVQLRVRECAAFENARLLYVAATRARRELHLFGHVTVQERRGVRELAEPERGSALRLLWSHVEAVFREAFVARAPSPGAAVAPASTPSFLRRFTADWTLPEPEPAVRTAPTLALAPAHEVRPEFDWASEVIRRIGTVVHAELERWAHLPSLPEPRDLERSRPRLSRLLQGAGVPASLLPGALERTVSALAATRADERGRWIFSAEHSETGSELALSGELDGEIVNVVLDRTFVDGAGRRWIIDFKTSPHEGGDREEFLDNEVRRYRPQLERYARLLRRMGASEVRCGLYFPLLGGWREWSFTEPGHAASEVAATEA